MDYANPSLAESLAAQYVAGTLRGRARRRFEALLPGHPALREAVQSWQARLMPLTAVLVPVTPPASVWQGIESRLWPAAAASAPGWWQRLGLWRGLAALATAAAFGLAILVANPPVEPPMVVVLQGTDAAQQPSFVASLSADGRALVTRPIRPVAMQADRVLELWAVPAGGQPRSLGLISARGATVVSREKLRANLRTGETAALAVSIEPPGGSPTGAPTGPVVFAGQLRS